MKHEGEPKSARAILLKLSNNHHIKRMESLVRYAPQVLEALIECHEPSKHEPEGCNVCAIIKRAGGQ